MIETLLWSCPICKTHDSISHREYRLRHDVVSCSACESQWELIRVVGGPDFNLRLISGSKGIHEKTLSEWYDLMMAGTSLEQIEHPEWIHIEDQLSEENLYLFGNVSMGFTSIENPLTQQLDLDISPNGHGPAGMRQIGPGQLLFTSHRLIFRLPGDVKIYLPWTGLHSVDTLMDKIFTVGFNDFIYGFAFVDQSVLKWLAYTRLWINHNENGNGHKIYQGYI